MQGLSPPVSCALGRLVNEMHAHEVQAGEVHTHEVQAREMHTYEVHACEMHVYEVVGYRPQALLATMEPKSDVRGLRSTSGHLLVPAGAYWCLQAPTGA